MTETTSTARDAHGEMIEESRHLPGGVDQTTPPPTSPPMLLEGATRVISKATLVPLLAEVPESGHALVKAGYARQLTLQPGEVEAVRELGGVSEPVLDVLAALEGGPKSVAVPPVRVFASLPISELSAFGRALSRLREDAGSVDLRNIALAAVYGFEATTRETPLGMLNLERLEMTPAGIERGELIATIPLAPLEETAVVEKEWSVQSKEFSSIVSDELEDFSETGVTDNTELAQSTTSQQQHSNQFNITGTVSGGIPVISGSATSSFTAQDSSSQSATDSRKHAKSLTQKASSRSKQEHKVTITTKSVVGREETITRKLRNPSDTDPIRIDYFSLLRKWRVRLYRYGLRLTYDIVVPEPGGALRKAYRELALLKDELRPFDFTLRHDQITPENYLSLGVQYGASGLPDPSTEGRVFVNIETQVPLPDGHIGTTTKVGLPTGTEIVEIILDGYIRSHDEGTSHPDDALVQFTIVGSDLNFEDRQETLTFTSRILRRPGSEERFLKGVSESPTLALF